MFSKRLSFRIGCGFISYEISYMRLFYRGLALFTMGSPIFLIVIKGEGLVRCLLSIDDAFSYCIYDVSDGLG